jgi:putative membrane protein
MPSDEAPRRLHPATIFFDLLGNIRVFLVPALLLMFGYGSGEDQWRLWGAVLVVPAGIAAVAQYLRFTYTYGPDELIVRSGVLFRKERHVPYSRIQNIDANQGILHRVFGVYNLTLESAGGAEPEAELSVLPEGALSEMRRRVFEGRGGRAAPSAARVPSDAGADDAAGPAPPAPEPTILLDLGLRDLALCGLIRGRGLLLLAGIFGLASQYGLDDQVVSETAEGEVERGVIATWLKSVFEGGLSFDLGQVLFWLLLFALVVLLLRLLSAVHTIMTFYGFRMTLADEDLRLSFGLLTRVKATIPLGRIQTITIREGALHRLFGVSSVRAATAGGGPGLQAAGSRYLAPILPRSAVAPLVRVLMPGADLDALAWQPAHPRAFRRMLVRRAVRALILTAAVSWFAGAWTVPIAAVLLAYAFLDARLQARHMAHSLSGGIFAFRSGWYMRQTTMTPLRKVQGVGLVETPFDRRHRMARLLVDTAGATGAPHDLRVPYLDRERALALSGVIAAGARDTTLSW